MHTLTTAASGRFRFGLAAAALAFATGQAALADDTEVLIGLTPPGETAPNVLMVIDTSGSMGSLLLRSDAVYDPDFTYSGPFTDANRIYWTTARDANTLDLPNANYATTNFWINKSAFVCDNAVAALGPGGAGYYVDVFAQFDDRFDTNFWGVLRPHNPDSPGVSGSNRLTECRSDEGLHGLFSGSFYPADIEPRPVEGPFTSDPNDAKRHQYDGAVYAFYSNNYLNWLAAGYTNGDPVVVSRLDIVKEVSSELISSLATNSAFTGQDFNVGLMRFDADADGGMVLQHVTDMTNEPARDSLINQIEMLTADGNTPLAETMYEGFRYLSGDTVLYGDSSSPVLSSDGSRTAPGSSTYLSPIIGQCQRNYVVLLTDGLPNSDTGADTNIAGIAGACTGNCLDELTQYMATRDFNAALPEDQSVETYTIGFFTDQELLLNAATGVVPVDPDNPNGPTRPGYFTADNTTQLASAFEQIFQGILTRVDSFTSPAVSINDLNRLTNRDTVYFTLFEPSGDGQPHWDGNLKAYRIGRASAGEQIQILDANGAAAVDPDTGGFKSTARSIWSEETDGATLLVGGVASGLQADRIVYTSTAGALEAIDDDISLTGTDFGNPSMDATELAGLVKLARGLDPVTGAVRKVLGDSLHTQPLIATFSGGNQRMLFATNDGYIHSINPAPSADVDDLEQFAFIPRDLLPNLRTLRDNQPTPTRRKMYGIDGPLTAWIDGDADGIVEGGETLYVYAGMRRGGRFDQPSSQGNYYALSFSGANSPSYEWSIQGGSGDFASLGQTWSAMTPGRMFINGAERDVLVFGGGYDPDQDNSYDSDSVGNAVYIVEATTGNLLWWASDSTSSANLKLAGMDYSIPSDVRIIDLDQDGLIDRMYVGDMGAQVWRFDVNKRQASDPLPEVTGGMLANLSEGGASNERRFYNAPSVARIQNDDGGFLTIAIGSGYRASPLNTSTNERFYMIKDVNVFGPPLNAGTGVVEYPAPITPDLLAEINNAVIDDNPDPATLASSRGWFVRLDNQAGEKNLAPALTFDNRIFFTTYSPPGATPSCDPAVAQGTARLYAFSILTGDYTLYDDSGDETEFVDLPGGTIPPSPTLVFTEPPCTGDDCEPGDGPPPPPTPPDGAPPCDFLTSEVTLVIGNQAVNPYVCNDPKRTYWAETDRDTGP